MTRHIEYFVDSKTVKIVVVYSVLSAGVVQMGFSVWHQTQAGESFPKRGVRDTALARFERKPIILRGEAPKMPLRRRKKHETEEEFQLWIDNYEAKRDETFLAAFGATAQEIMEQFPSPVRVHEKEDHIAYLARVQHANDSWRTKNPNLPTDPDVMRLAKAKIIESRRRFLREVVMLGYSHFHPLKILSDNAAESHKCLAANVHCV